MNEKTWVKTQDYFRTNSVTLTTGQTGIILLSLIVPQNLTLRLIEWANFCDAGWGFLTWRACWNRIPQIPLHNVRDALGGVGQLMPIEPINFPPASEFSVLGDNTDASSHTLGVIIRGELGYYE